MMSSSSEIAALPCSACGARGFYVLSPLRILARGVNGLFAQTLVACASVPERGFLSAPSEDDVRRATLTLRVCADCGASQLFTDPEDVRAMLDEGQPGVSYVGPERPRAPYR